MNIESFLVELAGLLEIDRMELTGGYLLEDNENWDSLGLISVIIMFDEHFNLSVSNEALRKCKEVGDLIKLVNQKKEYVEI